MKNIIFKFNYNLRTKIEFIKYKSFFLNIVHTKHPIFIKRNL